MLRLHLAAVALLAGAAAASAQPCASSHCDVLLSRLMISGESCSTQTFDSSQTVAYSRLVTGATDFGDISFLFPFRAFDGRFDGFFETDDPGFTAASRPCGQVPELAPLPADTDFFFDVLVESPDAGGAARNLLYWDAIDDTAPVGLDVNDVEWGPVPIDEQISIIEGINSVTVSGGAFEVEGYAIDTTGTTGSAHDHIDYRLRRSGGGTPSSGVYLLKLDLTVPGFAEGAPSFFVFAQAVAAQAEDVARQQVASQLALPACDDGIDNDRDGLVDFAGGDPGCDDAWDESEKADAHECDDGIDNDGDGAIDYREVDFGAADLYAERDPECDFQGAAGVSELPEPGGVSTLIAGISLLGVLARRRAGGGARRRVATPPSR